MCWGMPVSACVCGLVYACERVCGCACVCAQALCHDPQPGLKYLSTMFAYSGYCKINYRPRNSIFP